jgi:hypothetical protein
MGLTSKLLIIGALVAGYQVRGCIDPPEPLTSSQKIEKICDTKICDVVGESDPNKFNYNRLKHHSQGVFKEIDNYGSDMKPKWVAKYIDEPIIRYFKP